ALLAVDISAGLQRFTDLKNIGNLLFLGVGASALCFVTWNFAVKILGPIKTSVYIYIVPVITVVTSAFILHEKMTAAGMIGIGLTLAGLFLSESKKQEKGYRGV
ncbi:MAG: DMT family transporter, partial [Oscillospiraceae bacterium]|nr:DMT family transporter [Oscillospiraceae bacterium]